MSNPTPMPITGQGRPGKVLASVYATPDPSWLDAVCAVVRAGHVVAGPDGPWFRRDSHPGHEWIYCVAGQGHLLCQGTRHRIGPGDLVWVNGHHPHAYGPDAADPWEVLWLRFDGPGIEAAWRRLEAGGLPVWKGLDRGWLRTWFSGVFDQLSEGRPDPARCHASIGSLLGVLVRHRQDAASASEPLPARFRSAFERMRLYSHLPLRIGELARMAGVGESTFTRVFRECMGRSPMEWLRLQRLALAQRRLVESDDAMKDVARQSGWGDPFHFSKDFKRLTGMTPSAYRRQERGQVSRWIPTDDPGRGPGPA